MKILSGKPGKVRETHTCQLWTTMMIVDEKKVRMRSVNFCSSSSGLSKVSFQNQSFIRYECLIFLYYILGEPVKFSWKLLGQSKTVHCDTKKDLTQCLKVIVLDKHHNQTLPSDNLKPFVTVNAIR